MFNTLLNGNVLRIIRIKCVIRIIRNTRIKQLRLLQTGKTQQLSFNNEDIFHVVSITTTLLLMLQIFVSASCVPHLYILDSFDLKSLFNTTTVQIGLF